MNAIQITLPESDFETLQSAAELQKQSVEEFTALALRQMAKEWRDFQYWKKRGESASYEKFLAVLDKAPNVPPIPGDELPEGWEERKENNKH